MNCKIFDDKRECRRDEDCSECRHVSESAVKRVVMFELADDELVEMVGPVPLPVQIRIRLNKAGFEFTDDGKLSAVINENPTPVGRFYASYDIEKRTTLFKQWLET